MVINKLALLLSLLSSSRLLRARLVPEPKYHSSEIENRASLPLASVQLAASLAWPSLAWVGMTQ